MPKKNTTTTRGYERALRVIVSVALGVSLALSLLLTISFVSHSNNLDLGATTAYAQPTVASPAGEFTIDNSRSTGLIPIDTTSQQKLGGSTDESFLDKVRAFINWGLMVVVFIAVVVLIWAGVKMVYGAKDAQQGAMNTIKGVVFGIVLIGFSYAIVNFVIGLVSPRGPLDTSQVASTTTTSAPTITLISSGCVTEGTTIKCQNFPPTNTQMSFAAQIDTSKGGISGSYIYDWKCLGSTSSSIASTTVPIPEPILSQQLKGGLFSSNFGHCQVTIKNQADGKTLATSPDYLVSVAYPGAPADALTGNSASAELQVFLSPQGCGKDAQGVYECIYQKGETKKDMKIKLIRNNVELDGTPTWTCLGDTKSGGDVFEKAQYAIPTTDVSCSISMKKKGDSTQTALTVPIRFVAAGSTAVAQPGIGDPTITFSVGGCAWVENKRFVCDLGSGQEDIMVTAFYSGPTTATTKYKYTACFGGASDESNLPIRSFVKENVPAGNYTCEVKVGDKTSSVPIQVTVTPLTHPAAPRPITTDNGVFSLGSDYGACPYVNDSYFECELPDGTATTGLRISHVQPDSTLKSYQWSGCTIGLPTDLRNDAPPTTYLVAKSAQLKAGLNQTCKLEFSKDVNLTGAKNSSLLPFKLVTQGTGSNNGGGTGVTPTRTQSTVPRVVFKIADKEFSSGAVVPIKKTQGLNGLPMTIQIPQTRPNGKPLVVSRHSIEESILDPNRLYGEKPGSPSSYEVRFDAEKQSKDVVLLKLTDDQNTEYTYSITFLVQEGFTGIPTDIVSPRVKIQSIDISQQSTVEILPREAKAVTFDLSSSSRITKALIQFGDGKVTTITDVKKPVVHNYNPSREYHVIATLTDDTGGNSRIEADVVVIDMIPAITISPALGEVGTQFSIDASQSKSVGAIAKYEWAVKNQEGQTVASSLDKSFKTSFTKPGAYDVNLTITDTKQNQKTLIQRITVDSRPPRVSINAAKRDMYNPQIYVFEATGSTSPYPGTTLAYSWSVDANTSPTFIKSSPDLSRVTYAFTEVGQHTVTLSATDVFGKKAEKNITVTVDSLLNLNLELTPDVPKVDEEHTWKLGSIGARDAYIDFGDGTRSQKLTFVDGRVEVKKTYSRSQVFDATIDLTDERGTQKRFVKRVSVSPKNTPSVSTKVLINNEQLSLTEQACGSKSGYKITRGDTVAFDATQSRASDGTTSGLTYFYRFGDGAESELSSPTHVYKEISENGCFQVGVKVTDKSGKSTSLLEPILISVDNAAPTLHSISITPPASLVLPVKNIRVRAVGATDPDGTIAGYKWYMYPAGKRDNKQSIHITKSSETVFSIPDTSSEVGVQSWYFGVELTDNDSKTVDSFDVAGESFPLAVESRGKNQYTFAINVDTQSLVVGLPTLISVVSEPPQPFSAQYSYDFDGDGTYDREFVGSASTYVYRDAGVFKIKVKINLFDEEYVTEKTITVLERGAYTGASNTGVSGSGSLAGAAPTDRPSGVSITPYEQRVAAVQAKQQTGVAAVSQEVGEISAMLRNSAISDDQKNPILEDLKKAQDDPSSAYKYIAQARSKITGVTVSESDTVTKQELTSRLDTLEPQSKVVKGLTIKQDNILANQGIRDKWNSDLDSVKSMFQGGILTGGATGNDSLSKDLVLGPALQRLKEPETLTDTEYQQEVDKVKKAVDTLDIPPDTKEELKQKLSQPKTAITKLDPFDRELREIQDATNRIRDLTANVQPRLRLAINKKLRDVENSYGVDDDYFLTSINDVRNLLSTSDLPPETQEAILGILDDISNAEEKKLIASVEELDLTTPPNDNINTNQNTGTQVVVTDDTQKPQTSGNWLLTLVKGVGQVVVILFVLLIVFATGIYVLYLLERRKPLQQNLTLDEYVGKIRDRLSALFPKKHAAPSSTMYSSPPTETVPPEHVDSVPHDAIEVAFLKQEGAAPSWLKIDSEPVTPPPVAEPAEPAADVVAASIVPPVQEPVVLPKEELTPPTTPAIPEAPIDTLDPFATNAPAWLKVDEASNSPVAKTKDVQVSEPKAPEVLTSEQPEITVPKTEPESAPAPVIPTTPPEAEVPAVLEVPEQPEVSLTSDTAEEEYIPAWLKSYQYEPEEEASHETQEEEPTPEPEVPETHEAEEAIIEPSPAKKEEIAPIVEETPLAESTVASKPESVQPEASETIGVQPREATPPRAPAAPKAPQAGQKPQNSSSGDRQPHRDFRHRNRNRPNNRGPQGPRPSNPNANSSGNGRPQGTQSKENPSNP